MVALCNVGVCPDGKHRGSSSLLPNYGSHVPIQSDKSLRVLEEQLHDSVDSTELRKAGLDPDEQLSID